MSLCTGLRPISNCFQIINSTVQPTDEEVTRVQERNQKAKETHEKKLKRRRKKYASKSGARTTSTSKDTDDDEEDSEEEEEDDSDADFSSPSPSKRRRDRRDDDDDDDFVTSPDKRSKGGHSSGQHRREPKDDRSKVKGKGKGKPREEADNQEPSEEVTRKNLFGDISSVSSDSSGAKTGEQQQIVATATVNKVMLSIIAIA